MIAQITPGKRPISDVYTEETDQTESLFETNRESVSLLLFGRLYESIDRFRRHFFLPIH